MCLSFLSLMRKWMPCPAPGPLHPRWQAVLFLAKREGLRSLESGVSRMGSPQRSEKGSGPIVQLGMKRTSGILAGKVGDLTCQSCSHPELVGLLTLTAKGQESPRAH